MDICYSFSSHNLCNLPPFLSKRVERSPAVTLVCVSSWGKFRKDTKEDDPQMCVCKGTSVGICFPCGASHRVGLTIHICQANSMEKNSLFQGRERRGIFRDEPERQGSI